MKAETADAIVASLELASERLGDLMPAVYTALFADHPEMKPLFWRDTNNAVKGEMLAKVFEIILGFVGDNLFASNMIQWKSSPTPATTFRPCVSRSSSVS